MRKQEIRKLIADRKSQLSDEELSRLSVETTSLLLSHSRVQQAHTILLYYSMRGEVATHDLVEQLFSQGKTIFLPRVKNDTDMDLVLYTGKKCLQPAGSFHILEPQGEPYTYYNNIDLAIVPGIAFTKDGKRMGRGRGYYDRLLPQLTNAYKIGLAFPFQILEDIPTDKYDFPLDEIVATPSPASNLPL